MQTTEPTGRPHRNHGLFSDHYLNATLPGRPDWRALAVEAGETMEEIPDNVYCSDGIDTAVVEAGDLIDGTTAVTSDVGGPIGTCEVIRMSLLQ